MLSQKLSQVFAAKYDRSAGRKLTVDEITEFLYMHDLKKLRDSISSYLKEKGRVLVLFDNLDKSWSTTGLDVIDVTTLRCLIDAGRKVERDMQRAGHKFRCILFIRNDVYRYLMANSSDYGKEMRATLDWSDPDLLREMLRLRLLSNLEQDDASGNSFEDLWSHISISHIFGEESSDFIIRRSLMRPRNVLKLFNHVRGFAVNFGRSEITIDDYYKGLRAYSQDLLVELDRELSDVYPDARDLLYYFMDSTSQLSSFDLDSILAEAKLDKSEFGKVKEFLLYYGVLGLLSGEQEVYIFDHGYDIKALKIRAERAGSEARFVINPAFVPALEIKENVFSELSLQ